ncbi:hypothetical protein [Maize bushy stunt phytoplasma]|nr:hypothetical protein [Maize bushy stunt phytoplasma]
MGFIWQADRNKVFDYDQITPYFIVSIIYLFLVRMTNYLDKKTKKKMI